MLRNLKNIRLITFDVNNVLLTVKDGAANQYIRLARQHLSRPSFDPAVLQTKFVKAFQTLNRTFPGYGVNHQLTSRQWWTMLVDQTFVDYRLTSNELETLSQIIFDEFSKVEIWIKNDQADFVLEKLSKNFVLGVISNFDERLESLLEKHRLRSFFQFVLTPRTVGLYKPQKEIFRLAADRADLKSTENLCHIGDDVNLDYFAAKSARCQALLLVNDKKKLLNEHTQIPEKDVLTELKQIFA